MRHFATPSLLLMLLSISLYAISNAQESDSTSSDQNSSETQKLKIVPLVVVKAGETKELLLSTWCTVGVTRGGGFNLTEMRDGKPKGNGGKTYSARGVTISVPDFEEGERFASSSEYSLLKKHNIDAFKVSITASETAQSGLLEMHLIDATCSGYCNTDFRVLVVEQ